MTTTSGSLLRHELFEEQKKKSTSLKDRTKTLLKDEEETKRESFSICGQLKIAFSEYMSAERPEQILQLKNTD